MKKWHKILFAASMVILAVISTLAIFNVKLK